MYYVDHVDAYKEHVGHDVSAGDAYGYYNDAAESGWPALLILRLSACCCKDALVDPWL